MAGTDGPTDYDTITAAQQRMWSTGDFHEIARQNIVMAEALVGTLDPHAGEWVLDVGCGSGTAALVAARRYCDVAGIDYVPALIERARRRADAESFDVDFRVGDALALPFDDDSFDAVLSVYGVQFAADQRQAANELVRVCRPGGRIGLASPMAEGWSGDFFATLARHAPPPPGAPSPLRWGKEAGLEELLGAGTSILVSRPRKALQYYRSVRHAVEVFSTWFGPLLRALGEAPPEGRAEVLEEIDAVFARYNVADDGTAIVENTYLETVATVS